LKLISTYVALLYLFTAFLDCSHLSRSATAANLKRGERRKKQTEGASKDATTLEVFQKHAKTQRAKIILSLQYFRRQKNKKRGSSAMRICIV
jgi:hypothetical protein